MYNAYQLAGLTMSNAGKKLMLETLIFWVSIPHYVINIFQLMTRNIIKSDNYMNLP